MKNTKNLLKETFASMPNTFAYREIRFHVYHALQKLETLEKRNAAKQSQAAQQKVYEEEKKKTQAWQPPIYQSPSQVQHTLDILDKMIGEEKKVIEEIHAKNAKKGQVAPEVNDEDDDLQTLHG
jgi:predicted DNA-binding transcriptional regulator YafY